VAAVAQGTWPATSPTGQNNDMMNQSNIVVIDNPRTVNVMRKHTYLWGLITFYRAVK